VKSFIGGIFKLFFSGMTLNKQIAESIKKNKGLMALVLLRRSPNKHKLFK